jgi:hypothetical protein
MIVITPAAIAIIRLRRAVEDDVVSFVTLPLSRGSPIADRLRRLEFFPDAVEGGLI